MNEHEWLLGLDPTAMLDFVRPSASDRKLRLFACACVRSRWELLRYPTPRQAVELAERFAEGAARNREVEAMREQAAQSVATAPEFERLAYQAAAETLLQHAYEAATNCSAHIRAQFVLEEANAAISREDEVRVIQQAQATTNRTLAGLMYEIFGNPFRPVTIEPRWLHACDGAVLALARAIEVDRRMEELPYLADALLDAGCDEEALLRHLRQPGPHVRGCWALDAVLEGAPRGRGRRR